MKVKVRTAVVAAVAAVAAPPAAAAAAVVVTTMCALVVVRFQCWRSINTNKEKRNLGTPIPMVVQRRLVLVGMPC